MSIRTKLEDLLPADFHLRNLTPWAVLAVILIAVIALAAGLFGLVPGFSVPPLLLVVAGAWWMDRRRARRTSDRLWLRTVFSVVTSAVVVGLLIQLVPYGRDHSLAAVTGEPQWDSPRTRELAQRACFDCHSNEVDWPWYSYVAPVSWSVQSHVDKGRHELNYSEWDRRPKEGHESAKTVRNGSMPPFYYEVTHPSARLSTSEQEELIRGFEATFGTGGGGGDD